MATRPTRGWHSRDVTGQNTAVTEIWGRYSVQWQTSGTKGRRTSESRSFVQEAICNAPELYSPCKTHEQRGRAATYWDRVTDPDRQRGEIGDLQREKRREWLVRRGIVRFMVSASR